MRRLGALALVVAGLSSGCATGLSGTPTYVTDIGATVNGVVATTEGGSVTYWVEYGTDDSYGHESAHLTRTAAAKSSFRVSIPIAGLSPSTTYHYRICAQDAQPDVGPGCGEDATLTTDSPGGRSGIAFSSARGPGSEFTRFDIVVMGADGSNPTDITSGSGANEGNPAWSPDGRRIAFDCLQYASDGITQVGTTRICVSDPDGGNRVPITDNSAYRYQPAWSPDGSRIAFTRFKDGEEDIWVMDADGSNQVKLTNSSLREVEAAWSPDGSRIAYIGVPDPSAGGEVYVVDSTGGTPTRLTHSTPTGPNLEPAWTPDGRISFSRIVGSQSYDILTMNPDGSDVADLTNRTGAETAPSWSPDGSKLAFVDVNAEILSLDLGTRNTTNLTNNNADDFAPAWSPRPSAAATAR